MESNIVLSSDTSVDDLFDNMDESVVDSSDLFDSSHLSCTTKYITESDSHSFFQFEDPDAINLLHLNSRSLKKNYMGLQNLLTAISGKLTAIAVTETWLSSNLETSFNLPGYNFFSYSRVAKIGGGVAFLSVMTIVWCLIMTYIV